MKFEYNEKYIESNLSEMWDQCSTFFIEQNKDWYVEMNKWLNEFKIKKKLDIPLEVIVGSFSALSPQNSVKQNKIFLEHFYNGFQKHTWSQHNKCLKINELYGNYVEEQRVLKILNGLKTQRFYLNIMYPLKETGVTIDSHCINISGFSQKSVTTKQYLFLEKEWIKFAKRVDLLPQQLQSCLWVKIRQNLEKDKHYD